MLNIQSLFPRTIIYRFFSTACQSQKSMVQAVVSTKALEMLAKNPGEDLKRNREWMKEQIKLINDKELTMIDATELGSAMKTAEVLEKGSFYNR